MHKAHLIPNFRQLGCFRVNWLQQSKEKKLDKTRTRLLKQMLDTAGWRKLTTLRRVIGADREPTTRLLIEMHARGSEKQREDGEEVWGLISKQSVASPLLRRFFILEILVVVRGNKP